MRVDPVVAGSAEVTDVGLSEDLLLWNVGDVIS